MDTRTSCSGSEPPSSRGCIKYMKLREESMSKNWYALFLMLTISFVFAARPWHTHSQTPAQTGATNGARKGLFTLVEGNVKKKQMTDEDWIRAQVRTDVIGGDRVRTLQQSRAEMNLAQLDIIRL